MTTQSVGVACFQSDILDVGPKCRVMVKVKVRLHCEGGAEGESGSLRVQLEQLGKKSEPAVKAGLGVTLSEQ